MLEKEIYEMELFGEVRVSNAEKMVRVPGGWLFVITADGNGAATFIPRNAEFDFDTLK